MWTATPYPIGQAPVPEWLRTSASHASLPKVDRFKPGRCTDWWLSHNIMSNPSKPSILGELKFRQIRPFSDIVDEIYYLMCLSTKYMNFFFQIRAQSLALPFWR